MKNILICDDVIDIQNRIEDILKDCFSGELSEYTILKFSSGEKLLNENLIKDTFACFMDIEMPGENGIETARRILKINEKVKLMFISNYENQIFNVISLRPYRFIRKSNFDVEMREAALYLQSEIRRENRKITFGQGINKCTVAVNEILFIESSGHYVNIHKGRDICRIRGKVSEYIDELVDNDFIQIQKGIAVNMTYIEKIKSGHIYIKMALNLTSVEIDRIK